MAPKPHIFLNAKPRYLEESISEVNVFCTHVVITDMQNITFYVNFTSMFYYFDLTMTITFWEINLVVFILWYMIHLHQLDKT